MKLFIILISCVNTHDKPAADTYAHSRGYNSLTLIISYAYAYDIACG